MVSLLLFYSCTLAHAYTNTVIITCHAFMLCGKIKVLNYIRYIFTIKVHSCVQIIHTNKVLELSLQLIIDLMKAMSLDMVRE